MVLTEGVKPLVVYSFLVKYSFPLRSRAAEAGKWVLGQGERCSEGGRASDEDPKSHTPSFD